MTEFETQGKRRIAKRLCTSLALVALVSSISFAASAGPQAAMTGAPALGKDAAEGSCVSCHNSFPINSDTAGAIHLQGVPAEYEPGSTYSLTIRVSHTDPAAMRWGFQLTALVMSDGAGAGDFIVTDSATTQVLAAMTGTRSYIEQSYGGTAIGQTGSASWTFEWKAPSKDVGRIAFFASGNVANADGSNQGDRIYSPSPLPVAETTPTTP